MLRSSDHSSGRNLSSTQNGLAPHFHGAYSVRLPTELQWERAARADSLTSSHTHPWPWGEQDDVAQRANVHDSGIGHVSSVGSFAPSRIGLCDMAGNAWQWMEILHEGGETSMNPQVNPVGEQPSGPRLRGASWIDGSRSGQCSFRFGARPDDWNGRIGFRVVLCPA